MDFISLKEVIENMANCSIKADNSEEEAVRYSDVAAVLHRELYNNNENRPHWMAISNTTNQPLINDDASNEGMEILEHMAGWHERLNAEFLRYLTECEQAESAGIDVSSIRPSHKLGDGKYTRHGHSKASRIGFNRVDLITFLATNNITHTLSTLTPMIDDFAELKADNERLKEENETLKQENESLKKGDDTRITNTLYMMIYAMAIDGYGHNYDANRTTTGSEIRKALENSGLKLDEDTIRKHLKEAKKLAKFKAE